MLGGCVIAIVFVVLIESVHGGVQTLKCAALEVNLWRFVGTPC
jgi:hypothetical protein